MTTAGGPPESAGRLKPLSAGETIDAAIKLYRNNAVDLWKIVALIIVPIQILEVILHRLALPSDVFLRDGTLYTHTGGTNAGATVALLAVAILGLLGQLLATGAVFKLQLDAIMDRPHDIRHSFEFARHKIWSLVWLGLLETILIAIGFLLFIIPGVWLMVAVSVGVPVLMLENKKGFQAMKRSMNLVDSRWWATFGRLLLMVVLYAIVSVVIGLIVGAIANGVTNVTLFLVIDGIVRAALVILVSPFIAAVINWIYIDLRVRKEALDLEMLASGFGEPAPPAAATAAPTSTGLEGSSSTGLEGPSGPSWPPAG